MVKLTKIYTRTGDNGETHLAGGHRTKKTDPRIQAIGDIDELNSWLGMIAATAQTVTELKEFLAQCYNIQQQLFNLGAQLAILPADRRENSPSITQKHIDQLEQHIDTMNQELPMLTSFILPGGNHLCASIHIARAVCRRAERSLFSLKEQNETVDALPIQYINRLSDWLFVAARFVCKQCHIKEILWTAT